MAKTFIIGEKVMTKEGRAEVIHYFPDTFTLVVKFKDGHRQAMPSFEAEKIKEDNP